jgi:hypothetical protein
MIVEKEKSSHPRAYRPATSGALILRPMRQEEVFRHSAQMREPPRYSLVLSLD